MANPLVAEREDSTKAYSGVQIAESVADTQKAIESGDWASGVMGAVGTGLDALGMALDPFGAIFSAGVGWLIEHVGPVSDALDSLTGDPDEIKSHSETWKNVASELEAINTEMKDLVKADTANWMGDAGDAYRKRSEDTANLIAAAKSAADGAADGIGTAGEVVGAVRSLVRDIIAELVGHLISWALQVVCTLGIAMAWVVPQVVAEVAKVAAKIADITQKLIKAMKALTPLLKKLGDGFGDAKKALDKIKKNDGKSDGPASTNAASTKSDSADGSGTKGDVRGGDGGKGDGAKDEGGKTDGPASSGPAGTRSQSAGRSSSNKPNDPTDCSRKSDGRCTDETEPVDLATGEMVMVESDLEILNPLSLVLERMYVSSYRAGRWFGLGWSSTLDQRLEVDDEHVCYFSPDGMILVYPLPSAGAEELPIEGPRWPLCLREDGGYSLEKPLEGAVLHFRRLGDRDWVVPLQAVEGAEGRRIDVEQRRFGPPKVLRHSDGYRVDIDSEHERVSAVRVVDLDNDLNVLVMKYGYDDQGRLSEVINSSGQALRYLYDDAGRLTEWQDRNGFWFRYIYDEDGRVVRTVGSEGFFDSVFTYRGNVTTYENSLGGVKEFEFNDLRQIVRQTDALGNITRSEWDRYDRLLSRTDPLGRTTQYEYDSSGRPTWITRADGSVVRLFLAGDGTVETIAVNDGERTWTRHYPRGERPDPFDGKIGVAAEFNLESHSSGQVDVDEPKSVEMAPLHLNRDLFGRITERTTADGGRSEHGWTVDGHPLWQVDARGGKQQWRYDPEGNPIAKVDEIGGSTASEYGPFDVVLVDTDATGASTVRTYDTELNLLSVTSPQGRTWTYTYDLAGRVVEERDYDGRVLQYGYDAAGQLVSSRNGAGETTLYVHDVLGNLVEWRAPSGATTYTYSPVGNLVHAVNADAVLVREWDDQGRVTAEQTNNRRISFAYDDINDAVRRTTPSGISSAWSYGRSGVPRDLTFGAHGISFQYDAAFREIGRSVDDATKLIHEYDADRLRSQVLMTRSGHDVLRRRFEYRADGNLVGRSDDLFGQTRFQLDPAGRVVEVVAPGRHEQYSYDGLTNVVESEGFPRAEAGPRRYHGNTLVESGSVRFQHDQQGRMVLRSVQNEGDYRYEWDSYDRLVTVTRPDGAVWRYKYDPLGRRIAKQRTVPGPAGADPVIAEQVEFVWDGGMLVEQFHCNVQGNRHVTTWEYHPVTEAVVSQLELLGGAELFHLVVTDSLGKPTDLVAADGTLTWHDESSLWGSALPDRRATATTPLRFPGQYADAETGLNYNVYRYYDPSTGRYLSQDPLGLAPAPNPATYVSNPLRETDPLGLAPPSCSKKGGGSAKQTGQAGKQAANVKSGQSSKPNKKPDPGPSKIGKFDELTPGQQDAARKAKQWIRDHKDSGMFGAWHNSHDPNKPQSIGLGNNPNPGPGSTWGGRVYGNHGDANGTVGNESKLPHGDHKTPQPTGPDGKPMDRYDGRYYEFDVHPTPDYQDKKPIRDADQYEGRPESQKPKPDRLVMDDNGKYYYSPDHYRSWYQVP